MKVRLNFLFTLVLGLLFLMVTAPINTGNAAHLLQTPTPNPQIQTFIEQLTPEERIGQLFLVTFDGTDISEESQIYDLIVNHHIGGIVLQADSDNFSAAPDTLQTTWEMNRALQNAEFYGSLRNTIDPESGVEFEPAFIPLFIGISQEGGGYPYDQILNELTKLPNPMAIGATWQPDLAFRVGEVLGRELSSLGFNLLFGPNLDVLATPNPQSLGDVGTRSFGGDPFWVGEMGSAYIDGVHTGSENKIATVGTRFPGHGGSDRPPEEEIPTVIKSLEQLTQIELAPFFAVTGDANSPGETTDALLLSPIRYKGFQGNIRATTRPVNFDPEAFAALMSIEQFDIWRQGGGLIVSDELGSRAVRRYYDPVELSFRAHAVALDAFLAGNDVLFLENFVGSGETDNYSTIIRTLDFFAQKYRDDVAFALRVDESVARILSLKFQMYERFLQATVIPSALELENIGQDEQTTFEVSSQAATLLSPSPADLDIDLPQPPGRLDQIVFITDSFAFSQCSTCAEDEALPVDALEEAVVRLYGPQASEQILQGNLSSYSFVDLEELLDNTALSRSLFNRMAFASWIVVSTLDVDDNRPSSLAFRRLLAERPDLFQDKRLIVFSFDAPYYLDATEVSKITAYYGLYSRESQFIDDAARLLFGELTPSGASPVSIAGIGYDLTTATSPDQNQVIPLFVDLAGVELSMASGAIEGEDPPELQFGDLITLRTGDILDNNGQLIPDNTPISFVITSNIEGTPTQREINVNSENGIAQYQFVIESSGTIEIQVNSGEPQALSEILPLEIAPLVEEIVETEPPPLPTPTGTSTSIPQSTQEVSTDQETQPRDKTNLGDWSLAILVSVFVGSFAYQAGAASGHVRWGIRWGLTTFIGGLLINLYLAFGLPGSVWLLQAAGVWGVVISTLLGAGIGWVTGWGWQLSISSKQV
ncbi:MAG: hypothetical protein FVQ83_00505 [Chloroflexi bacterium]|nr:hypothetical protein [Chloroflexota bacterium]